MKRRTLKRDGLCAWLWMPGLWVVGALHLATAAEPIGERWRFETGLAGAITPALAPDGELLWTYLVDGAISSTPAVGADGTLYFGAANAARFHAVSASGTRLWMVEVSSGASQASPVIGLDGTVYCGGTDGRLFALSLAGQLKWSVPLGGEISGTPALAADGSLYVGTSGRRVFRVSDQGQVLGEFDTEDGVQGSPLIRPDGDVVVSDNVGTLYVLEGVSSPGGGPWPTHLQNAQRTGRAWAAPLVSLVSPAGGSEFVEGDAVRLAVELGASERPVVSVSYLSNSNEVLTVTSAPFEADWIAPGGVHFIQARAMDNQGATGMSEAVRIKVVPPETPPVLLLDPVGMTTTTNGGRVTLSVDVFGSAPLEIMSRVRRRSTTMGPSTSDRRTGISTRLTPTAR